jgi:hypothetical protein
VKQAELDLEAGIKARDEGMKAVAENSGTWFERAQILAPAVVFALGNRGWFGNSGRMPFSAEDLRLQISERIGNPHHSNTWGTLVRRLVKDGLIVPTGRTVPSRRTSSHAHATPEYEVMQ